MIQSPSSPFLLWVLLGVLSSRGRQGRLRGLSYPPQTLVSGNSEQLKKPAESASLRSATEQSGSSSQPETHTHIRTSVITAHTSHTLSVYQCGRRTWETPEQCLLGVVVLLVEPEGKREEFPLRIHEDVVFRQRLKLLLHWHWTHTHTHTHTQYFIWQRRSVYRWGLL